MARTKQTARRSKPTAVTWTRFHLPADQEWPTWVVAHENVHFGPLNDVDGVRKGWLGRMVEDPEQAAYIVEWQDLEHFEKFQSSPACAEFLQNLLVQKGAASSSPPLPAPSRFLTLQESTQLPKADVEGRVTFNAFLVPHGRDHETTRSVYDALRDELCYFQPRGFEFIRGTGLHWERYRTTWFWTLQEDDWVRSKFGKLEQTEETAAEGGRTVICEFHLWPQKYGATPEHEEAAAADPAARESWSEAVARVKPPVTGWVQERWDISRLPYYEPPYEPSEEQLEHERKLDEFIKYHEENPNPEPAARWCGTR
ncbi:hypothetical protein QBC43DRAFT_210287 [Cladorrhinum sp. PSN259]|nr:hypothetical protein QBC43DRAFT_210287 [Cladorrhinum sp. PSN259]